MSSNGMNDMDDLVHRIAAAYMTVQGDTFAAHGVLMHLSRDVVEGALMEHVISPWVEDEGEDCLAWLFPMVKDLLNGDAISQFGRTMLDGLLGAICKDAKQKHEAGATS